MNRVTEEHLTTSDFVAAGNRASAPDRRDEPQAPPQTGGTAVEREAGPLLPEDVCNQMRARWDQIQTGFVDEPRAAVQQADELVANAKKRLAETFSAEREGLERQWDRGDQINTEDLRIALRKYRSFFHRLLSV